MSRVRAGRARAGLGASGLWGECGSTHGRGGGGTYLQPLAIHRKEQAAQLGRRGSDAEQVDFGHVAWLGVDGVHVQLNPAFDDATVSTAPIPTATSVGRLGKELEAALGGGGQLAAQLATIEQCARTPIATRVRTRAVRRD